MDEKALLSRDDVWSIAVYQKGILYCILGYVPLIALGAFLQVAFPANANWVVASVSIAIALTALVLVFLLATKVFSVDQRAMLGILAVIPFVLLIVFLITYGRATGILRKHGIHVGLLGARMSDFNYTPRSRL